MNEAARGQRLLLRYITGRRRLSSGALFIFLLDLVAARKTSRVNPLLIAGAFERLGGLVKIHHFRVKMKKAELTSAKGNPWARQSANYRASA